MQGNLSKWTNYLHGWQERWVVLKDGTLSYYKSEFDTAFGCRGSISLAKATIEAAESGYGSESSLRKGGSMLSLSSVTSLGKSSTSSFKKTKGLREKLLELETFKDIIGRQIDTLQSYFDACADVANGLQLDSMDLWENNHDDIYGSNEGLDHDADDEMDELSKTPTPSSIADRLSTKGKLNSTLEALARGIDFRGEAITFKATTAGILATLAHCIDIMTKREDCWHRRLEKEIEKRKKAEAACKDALASARKQAFIGGPDFEEGPHCALNEEEFYDAMEMGLDRQEEQDEMVDRKVEENLLVIKENVDENWYLVHEDGDMKVFRREYEEGGIILDPMKATHIVKGVTAREMAHYFFDKDVRMDFDLFPVCCYHWSGLTLGVPYLLSLGVPYLLPLGVSYLMSLDVSYLLSLGVPYLLSLGVPYLLSLGVPYLLSLDVSYLLSLVVPYLLSLGVPYLLSLGVPYLLSLGVPYLLPLDVPYLMSLGVPYLLSLGVPYLLSLGVPYLLSLGVPYLLSLGVPYLLPLGVPYLLSLGVPYLLSLGVPYLLSLDVPYLMSLVVPYLLSLGVPYLLPLDVSYLMSIVVPYLLSLGVPYLLYLVFPYLMSVGVPYLLYLVFPYLMSIVFPYLLSLGVPYLLYLVFPYLLSLGVPYLLPLDVSYLMSIVVPYLLSLGVPYLLYFVFPYLMSIVFPYLLSLGVPYLLYLVFPYLLYLGVPYLLSLATIEYFDILEKLSDSTLIFHQVLKRIWPSSQRDFVFCSHIQDISPDQEGERLDNEVGYAWMVCNFSIDHPDAPVIKFVRVTCNVAMFCQTLIEPREEGQPLSRDHISCRITYSANVNPGGWAPPSVVRALSKREYPKFLRKITSLCQMAYQEKEIAI
ncbi:hypothetical protein QZH41_010662 [Actinostola sp. cb2023]|nr:hypothetical protein QZH41_010662 [Actinostola sp. cb2023]